MAGDAFEHIKSDAADMTKLGRGSTRPSMRAATRQSAEPPAGHTEERPAPVELAGEQCEECPDGRPRAAC